MIISMKENFDEYYQQIFYINEYKNCDNDYQIIRINFKHRFYLYLLIFLILTSKVNPLPNSQINYNHLSFPMNNFPLVDHSTPSSSLTYKVYRHHPIPSYSNGAMIQISDQTNINNQKQIKRERYRRIMLEKMFSIYDEDADGQLSKDEVYSLSLRLNIFPKFHHFLKNTSTKKD